ncbi:class I SAM-dependent methyltransferase [Candidatus Berkelbacteria bacterium]|nr:class I SAM-dependent methyltransferase [Candidatus Berkelbacteria bacterium]
MSVLEVGCGDGSRSLNLARRCERLTAIDPEIDKIRESKLDQIPNTVFEAGKTEDLKFKNRSFDAVIFTLSLHHVPIPQMTTAINEAIRVVRPNGYIAFLGPTEDGSFFEAELKFDACDGDERPEKQAAYSAISNHHGLRQLTELDDETVFEFDSVDDFINSMDPKKIQTRLKRF